MYCGCIRTASHVDSFNLDSNLEQGSIQGNKQVITARGVQRLINVAAFLIDNAMGDNVINDLITGQAKLGTIKDRQETILRLRDALATDSAVEAVKVSYWPSVFKSLFAVFNTLKQSCIDKHIIFAQESTAVAARLADIASNIRWLVERTVRRFNNETRKHVLEHLYSGIQYRGQLVHHVALNYAKALKCVVSWTPNMDHMDEKIWIKLVELSFNVILDDSLSTKLEVFYPQAAGSEAEAPDEAAEDVASPRKRRRIERDSPALFTSDRHFQQVEFASILTILLSAPNAPIISDASYLPLAILDRLRLFLIHYPTYTSLHQDYLTALRAALSHIAINNRDLTVDFAKATWPSLVKMWETKQQKLKEDLVVVLRLLFPYVTFDTDETAGDSGLFKLWWYLNSEAQNRKEGDSLSLSMDSLRLQISSDTEDFAHNAFVAKTFRYGSGFSSSQALAWAILELHADCSEKLYQLSESIHAVAGQSSRRRELQNPVESLLSSIHSQASISMRTFYLQALLFFVDRHWSALHVRWQRKVKEDLERCLSDNDPSIQSWSFMCLAAVAHQDHLSKTTSLESSDMRMGVWDGVWSAAMRRLNLPAVCRAACHAAQVLLHNSKDLLSSRNMRDEIESLAKELVVQGPPVPYDSVCGFFALCMRIASQDVSLYRLHLEEKTLHWLMDNWRPSGAIRRLPPYSVQDILFLLGHICSFSRSADLVCDVLLPDHAVVDAMKEHHATKIIRDYSLYATLPPFRTPEQERAEHKMSVSALENRDLVAPGVREQRISAFFLKFLDEIVQDREAQKDLVPGMEKIRSMIDLSVIALYFESLLYVNGTQWNRRVIQAACKVLMHTLPLLSNQRWLLPERAFMLAGFGPLYLVEPRKDDHEPWEALLPPGRLTGIRTEVLRTLIADGLSPEARVKESRRMLQQALFRSSDVQDAATPLLETLRSILQSTVERLSSATTQFGTTEDARDGFSAMRISTEPSQTISPTSPPSSLRSITDTCITALAALPMLHSREPTRDKKLTDWIANANPESLFAALPSWMNSVRELTFNVSTSALASIFARFDELLRTYNYRYNDAVRVLVTRLLQFTMQIWIDQTAAVSDARELAQNLSNRLLKASRDYPSWRNRDAILNFLGEYIMRDPAYTTWLPGPDILPHKLVTEFGANDDIRVRFRAATASARLLYHVDAATLLPIKLYSIIRESLSTEVNCLEKMLTRFLCLANLMIVSSTVRRGPYWHLLEASVYNSAYNNHIEAVLRGTASRMGFIDFSTLFDLYASQIAYSVRSSDQDITNFPPNLLGFRDKRECAERAFSAFTPMHVLAGDWALDGQNIFQNHCRIIHKTPHDGLLECLPEIIAYEMVFWASRHNGIRTEEFPELDALVKPKLGELFTTGLFDRYLRQQADGVVTAILRTLQEQDFTSEGPLVTALAARSESATQAFQEISALRNRQHEDHDPILPAFDAESVLDALSWFNRRVPYVGDPAITYHVLHRLFSVLDATPLVSEQLRIFNALCLWIACHHDHLKHATILHVLLNGATNIVSHIDLARDAQSLLHWAFTRLSHGPKDTRLTEILLRIACTAFDSSQSPSEDIAQSGSDILEWVEHEVTELIKSRSLRSAVRKALLVWPRECPKKLQDLVGDPTPRDLQNILSDERILSNKFRMVRQFCRLAEAGLYEEESFAKRDFWRLKQYIPPPRSLLGDELQAFITLLVHERGHINGLDRDYANRQTICMRYFMQSRKEPQLEQSMLSRKAIFASLLALLDDPSTIQVNLAFRTLRTLVAVTQGENPGPNGWPSEHHDELQLLGTYAQPYSGRPVIDLAQLLEQETSIRLSQDYPRWVTFFATCLSDALTSRDVFYGPLSLILHTDQLFAEQVLPILVHIYLHSDTPRANEPHPAARDVLSTYFSRLLSFSSSSSCHKLLVDVVLHLREWTPPNSRDPLAHDKWLTVDFTILSRNAVACGAYTTALLFLELASEYSEGVEVASQAREEILYQIYSHIDEPDGFYAISTEDVHSLLIKRLHHERQWDKAFQFHGAALETRSRDVESTNGVMQAFRAFGFDSLAMTTLQSISGAEGAVDKSMTYDLGWRAGMWDLPQTHGDDDTSVSLYLALRAINREREPRSADRIVMEQLLQQVDHLKRLGHENLVEIRQVSRTLICLNEVRQWCHGVIEGKLHPDAAAVYNNEYFSDLTNSKEFADLEAILATRISLLQSAREREQRVQIGNHATLLAQSLMACETSCLLRLSRAAREAGRSQIAINAVVKAQNLNGRDHFEVACEFANVLWLSKEPQMATEFLKGLLSTVSRSSSHTEFGNRASLLALMGDWASQACLEKPLDIKSHYFDASIASISPEDAHAHASVYHRYAAFAERQYHAVVKSPDVLRLKVYIERKTTEVKRRDDEIARARRQGQQHRHLEGERKKAHTLLNTDVALYTEYLKSRNIFLKQAVDMYSRCLLHSGSFDDDAAIRLCSLWFANFDNTDDSLPSTIGAALAQIPSHKFVFLAHQLSARLSDTERTDNLPTNQGNLLAVIIRMCKEHPFHALFPVFCLQADSSSGKSSRHISQSSQVVRAGAATSILSRLRSDPSCAQRISSVELVCQVSLQWAKYPIKAMVTKAAQKTFDIPNAAEIRKLSKVQVPVITKHTPLDPTGRYDNCVWIEHYEPTFDVAGGVNVPKICKCVGSDGQRYKQLFKGEGSDDLRQDAVMEQVFDLVNIVLRNDQETTRRNLRVRGYKVIPLASQAGVLEFVGNTIPLHGWLTRAHGRYQPGDIKLREFHEEMNKCRSDFGLPENVDPEKMTEKFVELRQRLRPVMRHYFTERTKDPSSWFRMRLYYARSVATTSIVGHIIGLGDRHLSNILLDNDNGEVVHIDLGIAFEQGKLLPVSERVPFRLTADMVDGLGTTGTQGVFQRCAEETLRVLRDRSDVILTVLEVFKHDPLHSWTASAMKLKGAQNVPEESKTDEALNHIVGFNVSTATGVDEAADRALTTVARKLDKTLSVEFTVNELIAEATDVGNLAMMYMGWSPYC